jgi:hypothetical protein
MATNLTKNQVKEKPVIAPSRFLAQRNFSQLAKSAIFTPPLSQKCGFARSMTRWP